MRTNYQIIESKDPSAFRQWLVNNAQKQDGVWLRIYKKASGISSITYPQALDEALCFGWIDGIKKRYDELSYIQKFTPRRKHSLWSKRNIEHVERLRAAGKMTQAGEAEVTRAKQDGRWQAAYDSPSVVVVPDYFVVELNQNQAAKTAFEKLKKSDRYSIVVGLQTARTEAVRARRVAKIIEKLCASTPPTQN